MRTCENGIPALIMKLSIFLGDIAELKPYYIEDKKHYNKYLRVQEKYINRMHSKYPSLRKNNFEQILNKREFSYYNKLNEALKHYKKTLTLYETLKFDISYAKKKHEKISRI